MSPTAKFAALARRNRTIGVGVTVATLTAADAPPFELAAGAKRRHHRQQCYWCSGTQHRFAFGRNGGLPTISLVLRSKRA
jgi:hypothetical protein